MKPGEIVTVKVGGIDYKTIIDDHGVQRFVKNTVTTYLWESGLVNLNSLYAAYGIDKFSQRDYAEFMMGLGYSVCGFAELSSFLDMDIENPLWDDDHE